MRPNPKKTKAARRSRPKPGEMTPQLARKENARGRTVLAPSRTRPGMLWIAQPESRRFPGWSRNAEKQLAIRNAHEARQAGAYR